MAKRLLIVLLTLLVILSPVFSEDSYPSTEDLSEALSVILDCLSATLASSLSPSNIVLPSCTASFDHQSGLPSRVAFFLADPDEMKTALGKSIGVQGNIFSTFISLVQKTQHDPLVSAAYIAMTSHGYDNSDYLLSGFVNFNYSKEISIDEITDFFLSKKSINSDIKLDLGLTLRGLKSGHSISISGLFSVEAEQDGVLAIVPDGIYTINGYNYAGGKFIF